MKNNILNIKNLKKIYHDKNGETLAIDDICLSVKDKDFISIVGPSGCGKSTLLSILADLEKKSDGIIEKSKDFRIGYMLQSDSLLPWRTVLSNCLLGLEIYNELTEENKERVINLLKSYGLYEFKDKYPRNLSGGMRQRVALIRTLAINPDILLLDEPFSALDYQTRLSLADDVSSIIKKENKTAIMVTHDLADVRFFFNINIYFSMIHAFGRRLIVLFDPFHGLFTYSPSLTNAVEVPPSRLAALIAP